MAEGKKKKISFASANIPLAVLSAVLALVLWIILSMTAFPEMSVFLYDVPIDFSLDGSYAQMAGLSVIQKDLEQVNLTFTGRRDTVSGYTNDDIHIRLNLDAVRSSGAYTVPLIVESKHGDILDNVSVVPDSAHISFDKLSTKTLSVADGTLIADVDNISAETGYLIDPSEVTITPSEITISGPQDYIDQVTSCVLSFELPLSLKSTRTLSPSGYALYNGVNVFENPFVSMSTENFSVKVPVYMTKNLPLNVVLTNYTSMIDETTIPYTLSTESIKVRSEDRSLENLKEITLGFIDIRDIEPGYVKSFEITQNTHYTNISGINQVNVNFDLEGYTEKSITLTNSQIHLINAPANYDIVIEQDKLRVMVVGPEEILENLDSSNFVGQVDLMDYEMRSGIRFLSVTIYAPGYPEVWAVGRNNQVFTSFEPIVPEAAGADNQGE